MSNSINLVLQLRHPLVQKSQRLRVVARGSTAHMQRDVQETEVNAQDVEPVLHVSTYQSRTSRTVEADSRSPRNRVVPYVSSPKSQPVCALARSAEGTRKIRRRGCDGRYTTHSTVERMDERRVAPRLLPTVSAQLRPCISSEFLKGVKRTSRRSSSPSSVDEISARRSPSRLSCCNSSVVSGPAPVE